jgi:quinol monooxygenase YgiN
MLKTALHYSRPGHPGLFYPEEPAAIPQQRHELEKQMILATVRMTIPPQKSGEVMKILRSMAEQCRDDPGCLSCHIYGDLQEKNVLVLEEVWRTEEDLDLHLRSGEYLNLLLVLEMSLKQPEIRFDTISSSMGIEAIEKARSRSR